MQAMEATGRVEYYDVNRGFGFIRCAGIDSTVFVHASNVRTEGTTLQVGDTVALDIVPGERRPVGKRVTLIYGG
ncbi:putative cold-shock DNA-binding protein [Paenibacillus pabuli]|uniref:Cold-shock DNA-binding protein n=1 Tax=Paenibacillus pabuli TaxID=1472 RepID=A0ABX9BKE1_9BACL|nr:putative cold-shock DNA-binding protein [Paenibacillus pabuli]